MLTFLACLFIAGVTAVYTPIYDAASDALPVEENGRGVGILDLMMNTSASIGVGVYSSLMASDTMGKGGLFGVGSGVEAQTSNMFWIMCAVSVLSMIVLFVFSQEFYGKTQCLIAPAGAEHVDRTDYRTNSIYHSEREYHACYG